MKRIFLIVTIAISTVLLFNSCDMPEGPYIEANPYTGVYDSDLPIRKILVEDFTGWNCVNCPKASQKLTELQNIHGGHIILVSIHYGFFAIPFSPGDPDFATEVGADIGESFSIPQELPKGMINRKLFEGGSNYHWEPEDWASRIVDILKVNKFADVDIDLSPEYNEADSMLSLGAVCVKVSDVELPLSLVMYLIESDIEGRQKNGSQLIEDYQHNHVFRGGIIEDDPTWGEEIALPFFKNYNFKFQSEWDANHCSVIAVVYNTLTLEVIQAEEVHVIEE
jgi:hypothetical protein